MRGSAALKIVLGGLAAWLGIQSPAFAARIALTPGYDHPGASIKVKGTHFGANEPVDVYFDSTDELLVATNGKGAFRNHNLPVPADALPGIHWVTAIGRNSKLAAEVPFSVSTDWAMYNFSDNRNGDNPYENVLSTGNVSGLVTDWSFPLNENAYVNSSPAVVNGAVYVGSVDSNLYAFDAASGALLWATATNGAIYDTPAVANGVVYAGTDDLYAFDASTGSQLWQTHTAGTLYSSPAVAKGIVYVGSLDGKLYALDASTGAQVWSYDTGTLLFSSPAVANGVVYVGAMGSGACLYAFNASTGALLWQVSTSFCANIAGAPAVANGVVYVGNFDYSDNDFYAFNASTGTVIWQAKLGRVIDSSAAVANGVVYIETDGQYTHTENDVIAMNASTGAILWSTVVPTSNGGGEIMSSPAVANGVLYVGSGDGTLYAFDAASGSPLWNSGTLGEFIFASPSVTNGMVYVDTSSNTNMGTLYAFALNGGKHAGYHEQRPAPDIHALQPDWRLKLSN